MQYRVSCQNIKCSEFLKYFMHGPDQDVCHVCQRPLAFANDEGNHTLALIAQATAAERQADALEAILEWLRMYAKVLSHK